MTTAIAAPAWNDLWARAWIEMQAPIDLQLAPLGRRAMATLAPRAGERVLDIGCGSGQTALELAHAVAPGGSVLGVDVAAPLLELARSRAGSHDAVAFAEGDAQVFPFHPGTFDAAFSRFGVMFFADPVAAFANIRRALKPHGRLAFVCWRALAENPLDSLPLAAAAPYLPPLPPEPTPDAPGPFAFADPDRVRGILTDAGFEAIAVTADDQAVGSGDLEAMLEVSLRVGALGKILRENPHLRDAAVAPVRAALAAHDGPDGVKLDAATWVVTARSPG